MKPSVTLLGVVLCLSYASAFNSKSTFESIFTKHMRSLYIFSENPMGIAEEAAAAARQRLRGRGGASSYASLSNTSLLIAEPWQLSKILLDPPSRRFVERSAYTGGVDYHARRNRVYWSEISTGRIYERSLYGRRNYSLEIEPFFELSPREWRPRAISVDFVGDKLYVLDTRGKRIHVLDLESERRSVIFEGDLRAPTDIAVDPKAALMFVADRTRLLRFNMDGSGMTPIVSHPRYRIRSVTLDAPNRRVFWSDLAFHRIKSADYEGRDVRVVVKNGLEHSYALLGPAQLAYHDGTLYFYDDTYRTISALGVDNGAVKGDQPPTKLYNRLDVHAIRAVNSARQPRLLGSSPCDDRNAGCAQICLIARELEGRLESKCACDVGKTLAEDARTCV